MPSHSSNLQSLAKEITTLKKRVADLELKNKFISTVINAKASSEGVRLFRDTLHGRFLEFANHDNSLQNEAEVFADLQRIEKELEVISSCPELHQKSIIAIGGGFSAGKSEFISSFIESDTRLPSEIQPTTAIPTYVLNSRQEEVLGYNLFGGKVNLNKVDKDFHLKLSHQFIESFDFNIKELLPFIILQTRFKLRKLCFVDTPGYNPSTTENYNRDVSVAKNSLSDSENIIWLVGLDSTGTMPKEDIKFLDSLGLENKRLYVILNKADLKPRSSLKEIIKVVQDSLDDYDIKYEGIQTFSSIKPHEQFECIGKSLKQFLKETSEKNTKHFNTMEKLENIHSMYTSAIQKQIDQTKKIRSELHSLELDMLEGGLDRRSKGHRRLKRLEEAFKTEDQGHKADQLHEIMSSFKQAASMVFQSAIVDKRKSEELVKNKQKKEGSTTPAKRSLQSLHGRYSTPRHGVARLATGRKRRKHKDSR